MKRTGLLVVVLLGVTTTLAAQSAAGATARVTEFSGKVEYRLGSRSWRPVSTGLEIPLNATISTGFGARAVLQLASSRIEVGQLTRLTVEELADDGSTVSTGVFVPVGRVRASVETPPARSTDFRVRTAQSTAAVRGTEFDTNGWQLWVSEGAVEFADLLGRSRTISATQISAVTTDGLSDPQDELNERANIGDTAVPDEFRGGPETSGYITVRWE
jgi:hypothetical protein